MCKSFGTQTVLDEHWFSSKTVLQPSESATAVSMAATSRPKYELYIHLLFFFIHLTVIVLVLRCFDALEADK